MTDPRLDRLALVAWLIRDGQLQRLSSVVARRDAAMALRDGLAPAPCDDPAALFAQAAHGIWAERRHAALTAQIARLEAEIAAQKTETARAFARAQVLQRLKDQLS